jgi:hypothetical protein
VGRRFITRDLNCVPSFPIYSYIHCVSLPPGCRSQTPLPYFLGLEINNAKTEPKPPYCSTTPSCSLKFQSESNVNVSHLPLFPRSLLKPAKSSLKLGKKSMLSSRTFPPYPHPSPSPATTPVTPFSPDPSTYHCAASSLHPEIDHNPSRHKICSLSHLGCSDQPALDSNGLMNICVTCCVKSQKTEMKLSERSRYELSWKMREKKRMTCASS